MAGGVRGVQVKAAYCQLCVEWHPDLNPDYPNATAILQAINKAWEQFEQEQFLPQHA